MKKREAVSQPLTGEEINAGPVRIQDKLQLERTAKAKRWDIEKDVFTTTSFLVWHATKRTGLTDLTYEAWLESIEDCELREVEDEDVTEDSLSQY